MILMDTKNSLETFCSDKTNVNKKMYFHKKTNKNPRKSVLQRAIVMQTMQEIFLT